MICLTKEDRAKQIAIENEIKAQELLNDILKNYQENPEVMAEAFAFASKFYTYSPKNTQLIHAQNPYATYCQSFKDWKDMGTSVLKGQHGYKIWVPVQSTLLEVEKGKFVQLSNATKEQKEAYKSGEIKGYKRVHFKIGTVFDIAQTSFPKERYPELFNMGYSSNEHQMIYQGIVNYINEKMNWSITREDLSSISLRGYCNPALTHIVINEKLEDTQMLSTTLHELGHALIHCDIPNTSVAQKEIEADALSIMLESTFGVPVIDSRKRHFANHFNHFKEEILEKESNDKAEEKIENAINQVFQDVFEVYRQNIEDIQLCVSNVKEQNLVKEVQEKEDLEERKEEVKKNHNHELDNPMMQAIKRREELNRQMGRKKTREYEIEI